MHKILSIAKWEFLEKIKTKIFIISIILTPLLIISLTIIPSYLVSKKPADTKVIGILDPSGIYFKLIKDKTDRLKTNDGLPRYVLVNVYDPSHNLVWLKNETDKELFKNRLDGYMLFQKEQNQQMKIQFRCNGTADITELRTFEEIINMARIEIKLKEAGIAPLVLSELNNRANISAVKVYQNEKDQDSNFLYSFFASLTLVILLMMMILSSGGMLVRSILEEKSNRLIEILISSCTPMELLTGKIIGLSALGLFQMIVWLLIGFFLVGTNSLPAGVFNHIGLMIIYFILGFIFYTGIFVGIGAIVTTEQESQQVTSYLSIILILPVVFSITAIQNPNSELVKILLYIPFTTPSIMLLRFNITQVPTGEIILTLIILIISIFLTIFLASKIFKIGILSYGKRPSIRELYGWIRTKR